MDIRSPEYLQSQVFYHLILPSLSEASLSFYSALLLSFSALVLKQNLFSCTPLKKKNCISLLSEEILIFDFNTCSINSFTRTLPVTMSLNESVCRLMFLLCIRILLSLPLMDLAHFTIVTVLTPPNISRSLLLTVSLFLLHLGFV